MIITCAFQLGGVLEARAQATDNVGIGTATPDNSALLELNSTSKGLLVPRLTQQERDAVVQPSTGLLIFNTTTGSFQYNFGTKAAPNWVTVLWFQGSDNGSANQLFWSLAGNDSVKTNHFLGTINDASLVLKSNNITRMVFTPTGDINLTGATSVIGSLNLDSTDTPLFLDGSAGARGGVFISSGPTLTPRWTSDLVVSDTAIILDTKTYIDKPLTVRDSSRFLILPKLPLQYGHLFVGDANDLAVPFPPGVNGSLMQIVAGQPQWVDPDKTEYWTLNGNSGVSAAAFVGTRDANDLRFGTDNTFRMMISSGTGEVTINSLTGSGTTVPPNAGEGLVMVDAAGKLFKRENQSLLQLPQYHMYLGDANNVAQPFAPGADSSFLVTMAGIPSWVDGARILRERPWIIGGNIDVGAFPILGNMSLTGVRDLDIYAGGQSMLFLNGTTPQIDAKVPFNLAGATTPLLLNGNSGTDGMVLISRGVGATPEYVDSLTLRSLIVSNTLTVSGRSEFVDTATFRVFPKLALQFGHLIVGDANNWSVPVAPGLNGSLLQIVAGTPQWVDPDKTEYWTLTGNSAVPAAAFVGTRDLNDLRFGTNNTFRMSIAGGTGEVTMNNLAGAGITSPITPGEGFVIADNGGRLIKRDIGSLLSLPEDNLFIGDSNNVASPFPPGADSTFLGIFNGKPTWYNLGSVLNIKAWLVGGNTTPPSEIMGNLTAGLDIVAGGTTRLYLQGASEVVDVRSSLNLDGTNRELRLNGNPGTDGFVLVSFGPGRTPYYTDSLVLRKLRVTDSLIIDSDFDIPLTFAHMFVGDASNKASELAPGINGSLLQIVAGQPQWVDPDKTEYWALSGNSATSPASFLGTRDLNDLRFGTNNTFRMTISGGTGEVTVNNLAGAGTTTPLTPGEGFVIADNGGRLIKRDIGSLLRLPENNLFVGDSNDIAAPFAPGADSTFLGIFNGTPTWYSLSNVLNTRAWLIGGNTAPPSEVLGNLTSGVDLVAGGTTRLYLQGASEVVDVRSSLNLDGVNRELRLNGNPGTDGFVLVSFGPGKTPYYTDSLVLRKLRVTDSLIIDGDFDIPLTFAHMFVGDVNNVASELAPGINGSLLQIVAGQPQWVDPDKTEYWALSGNSATPASAFVGTRDANDLRLGTNNSIRMTVAGGSGEVTITNLAGAGIVTPPSLGEGFVIADNAGKLIKRDLGSFLQLPENYIYVGDTNDVARPFAPGADSTFLGIFNGAPTWYSLTSLLNANAWMVGGNPNPPSPILGNLSTSGVTDLDIRAGGQTRLFLQGGADVVDVRSSLNLDGTNREMRLNGNPGTDGFVFVSWGPGKTPYYTDSLVLRKLRVTDSLIVDGDFDIPLTYAHMFVGDASNMASELAPGINGSLLQIVAGVPQWVDPDKTEYWAITGNTATPPTSFLGTRDLNDLRLGTNNTFRMSISGATGEITVNNLAGAGINTPLTPGEGFVIADNGGRLIKRDIGSLLELPENYIYVGDSNNVARPFAPGADSTFLGIFNGAPTWYSLSSLLNANAWMVGGNPSPPSPIIGNLSTTGVTDLDVRAGGQTRLLLQGGAEVVDVRSSLNLDGTNREMRLNGNPGTDGFVFVSWGPGRTPYYTDSLVLRKLRVTDSLIVDGDFDIPLTFAHMFVGDAGNMASELAPGVDGSLLQVVGGVPTWLDGSLSGFWSLKGNTNIAATAFLGTTDANDLRINTNNTLRLTVSATGQITVNDLSGTTVPGALTPNEGFVSADATGRLVKRDLSSILALPQHHLYVGDATNTAAPFAPGADSTFLGIFNGAPTWYSLSSLLNANAWMVGGNPTPPSPILGNLSTTGVTDLDVRAGGQTRLFLQGGAEVVDVRSSLNLDGTNREMRLNGNPGTDGFVFVSWGPGKTPYYTDSLVLRKLRVIN